MNIGKSLIISTDLSDNNSKFLNLHATIAKKITLMMREILIKHLVKVSTLFVPTKVAMKFTVETDSKEIMISKCIKRTNVL